MVWPIVTWPSPAITTLPSLRTDKDGGAVPDFGALIRHGDLLNHRRDMGPRRPPVHSFRQASLAERVEEGGKSVARDGSVFGCDQANRELRLKRHELFRRRLRSLQLP